jgi:hypothetical protein
MTDHTDWWFHEVESTFDFLVREYGFTIDDRFRHFKGNAITYARSDMKVSLESAPDWNTLSGLVVLRGPRGGWRGQEIDQFLDRGDPKRPSRYPSDSGPLDREAIAITMATWALALRGWLDQQGGTAEPCAR